MAASNELNFVPARQNCVYTKCYCEENVWHLCKHSKENNPDELNSLYTVFISNHAKCVPIWKQKSAKDHFRPAVWDYHVILLYKSGGVSYVFDLDTLLPFPCSYDSYVEKAFGSEALLLEKYHRLFRVIPASIYLEKFASDRSHMLKEDKSWVFPPPEYPCIQTDESCNNLQDFISMDHNIPLGEVMNLQQFCARFGTTDLFVNLVSLIRR